MNHISLIGVVCSIPRLRREKDGREIAVFNLETTEASFDKDGKTRRMKVKHKICTWGHPLVLFKEQAMTGTKVALEGKLSYRFYMDKSGTRRSSTTVEANDLFVMA